VTFSMGHCFELALQLFMTSCDTQTSVGPSNKCKVRLPACMHTRQAIWHSAAYRTAACLYTTETHTHFIVLVDMPRQGQRVTHHACTRRKVRFTCVCVLQCPAPRAPKARRSTSGVTNYCLPVSHTADTCFWRTWPAGGGKAATSGICFPRHPCWRCFFPRLAAHDRMAVVCVAATQRCAAALLVTHSCAPQGASGQYLRRLQHLLPQLAAFAG